MRYIACWDGSGGNFSSQPSDETRCFSLVNSYCGWLRNPAPPWMVETLQIYNGINMDKPSINWCRISLAHPQFLKSSMHLGSFFKTSVGQELSPRVMSGFFCAGHRDRGDLSDLQKWITSKFLCSANECWHHFSKYQLDKDVLIMYHW